MTAVMDRPRQCDICSRPAEYEWTGPIAESYQQRWICSFHANGIRDMRGDKDPTHWRRLEARP